MQLKLMPAIFAAVILTGCSSAEQPQAIETSQESVATLHKGWTIEGLSSLGIAGVSPEAILEAGTVTFIQQIWESNFISLKMV